MAPRHECQRAVSETHEYDAIKQQLKIRGQIYDVVAGLRLAVPHGGAMCKAAGRLAFKRSRRRLCWASTERSRRTVGIRAERG